jgi:hypothetical protein
MSPLHPRAVLQTCRLEGAGLDLYGREDVATALTALNLDKAEVWLDTGRTQIAVADECIIWLESSASGIARVWVAGHSGIEADPMAAIDIPASPDLAQAAPVLQFEPSDHPELGGQAMPAIADACRHWPGLSMRRIRSLVIRATAQDERWAALVLVQGEVGRLQVPRQCWGIALSDGQTILRRHDETGLAANARRLWRPRL